MSAIGSSGADVDVNKMDISFKSGTGQLLVCENGLRLCIQRKLQKILEQDHIQLLIYLKDGSFSATAYGCDLTYDYVRINADIQHKGVIGMLVSNALRANILTEALPIFKNTQIK